MLTPFDTLNIYLSSTIYKRVSDNYLSAVSDNSTLSLNMAVDLKVQILFGKLCGPFAVISNDLVFIRLMKRKGVSADAA